MIKKFLVIWLAACCLLVNSLSAQKHYEYASYSHDSLHARIYTLDNGMKVYLTVYKDAPRIQCFIPVRVGSKNDPAQTTGLAHYLEHLMFKGTTNFGTTNWQAEQPLLSKIDDLFEYYRQQTDQHVRDSVYHLIDSISYVASGYAIPNEYDKMMKFIGSQGTNAATSNDYTIYIENIPSNELENWAKIQAERFLHPVFRLFHTELEAVYEEKNTSLANDGRKASETMLSALFPKNPYGQQTTLGRIEHLKNPSLVNIRNFYSTYYVPNNMAVCLSGDFDYDEAIAIIDKYLGQLQSKPLQHYRVPQEDPISHPVTREVVGREAEFVTVSYRMDLPANSRDIYILRMLDNMLSNGQCGLMDVNLNQKHAVYSASGYPYILCDNSAYVLNGRPKSGQSLEEVRDLMLQQIQQLKQGNFDESLIQSTINNLKLSEMQQLENNRSRASLLANAFENDVDWYYASQNINQYSKITKQDIVNFANAHFGDSSYVVVYKRQGTPEDPVKISKPAITPIQVNRDAESPFFQDIKNEKVSPIQPEFVDFSKAITFDRYKTAQIDYLHNSEDGTFTLNFVYKVGEMNDLRLPYAVEYLDYLGTSKMTAEAVKAKFYNLACHYSIRSSDKETTISLSGLAENSGKAIQLLMNLIQDAQPDTTALNNVIADVLKQRKDAKSNQTNVMNCLRTYSEYGPELVNYQLKNEQLQSLTDAELIACLRQILKYQPEILYYGPASLKQVKGMLVANYKMPKSFDTPAPAKDFKLLPTSKNVVYYAPYPAKQSRLITYTRGGLFDKNLYPIVSMYNQYFGGSMNAIVFQEMREKRSLAYSAQSAFMIPSEMDDYMYNYSYVATQNDKIMDALTTFDSLFNAMPLSQSAFDLAKEGAKNAIASNRITKMSVLNTYLRNKKLGYDYDYRKDFYNKIDGFTLDDIQNFNNQYIKNQPKTYMILATDGEVDLKTIGEKFGPVKSLSLEDIFGY